MKDRTILRIIKGYEYDKGFGLNDCYLPESEYQDVIDDIMKEQRNSIIRAINYSVMNLDELKKEAISQYRTVGEVYYDKIITE
jgi:hypothetical protein